MTTDDITSDGLRKARAALRLHQTPDKGPLTHKPQLEDLTNLTTEQRAERLRQRCLDRTARALTTNTGTTPWTPSPQPK